MSQKFLDQNGLLYLFTKIKSLFVQKETGKGLSSNDFTNTLKGKLDGIATGAQVNKLEGVKVNGVEQTIDANKKVDLTVPTKTSDIENDSGFITTADIPEGAAASTTPPKMDGTVAVGTELAFARGDHVHPSDTTRVPTTRKVNGKALSSDITLGASDVSAVPTTRKVNGKALSADVTLAAGDVGAVPTTRTVNGHALGANVTLDSDDVGAVPATRTVNGKELSADITLSAGDVSAIPTSAKGAANGVASLDSDGKVPSSQLPSYVDDVVEGHYYNGKFYTDAAHATQITGETSKIYLDLDTNYSYRYSGTTYVLITSADLVPLTNEEIEEIYNNAQ